MTSLPPPGEPDIYEALLNVAIEASEATRIANDAYYAALVTIRRAFELTSRHTELLEQVGELSNQADEAFEAAMAMNGYRGPEPMQQARALFRKAAARHGEARELARQMHFSVMQASPLLMQGIEAGLAASEAHRKGLERAATWLRQARRRQSNGEGPEAPDG